MKFIKKFVILIDNDSQSCIILVENDYQYRLEHSPHIFRSYWIGHFQLSLYMPVKTNVEKQRFNKSSRPLTLEVYCFLVPLQRIRYSLLVALILSKASSVTTITGF